MRPAPGGRTLPGAGRCLLRGTWGRALSCAVTLLALTAFGVASDVLDGPRLACRPGC